MENNNDELVLERLLQSIGTKRYTTLAKALGIKPQSISDAKAKRKIPVTWVVTIAAKYGISIDWLIFGQGSTKREKALPDSREAKPHPSGSDQSDSQSANPRQKMLESRLEELEKENMLLKEANNSHKEALWACRIAIQALQTNAGKEA